MQPLSEEDQQRIEEANTAVERYTEADMLTVVASRSDSYVYVSAAWAALAALFLPCLAVVSLVNVALWQWILLQWGVFFILLGVFRSPSVVRLLTPSALRKQRVRALAQQQYAEQKLDQSDSGLGVLVLVSRLERVADVIISPKLAVRSDAKFWSDVRDRLNQQVEVDDAAEGILRCLRDIEQELVRLFPVTQPRAVSGKHVVILEQM